MNTLTELKSGIDHAWHSLAEGWQQFRSRASHALTRFKPRPSTSSSGSTISRLDKDAIGWGVLATELSEDDKTITVKIEAPGMEAEDFDISVMGNDLIVRGEKRAQAESNKGRYHIMECAYGQFERIIPLDTAIDQEHTKARYRRGVLTLELLKKTKQHHNRILIE